jgi:DNA polymerase-3 subunit alpha
MGIKGGPPSINQSAADFTVVGQGILFGLAGIKGVGDKAVEAILASRAEAGKFEDLYHFCEHADLRAVNRATLEALIKCGAFDGMGAHRAAMMAALDGAIQHGQQQAADRRSGQMSFFDSFETGPGGRSRPQFPNVEPWTEARLLAAEKETLGFYITSHPLTSYGRELDNLGNSKLALLRDLADGAAVTIGCMVSQVRPRLVRQGRSAGQKMAMLTVEDLTGSAECVIFSDAFERVGHLLEPEAMVFLLGTVDRRREEPNIVVDDVIPIAQAAEQLTGSVELKLDAVLNDSARLQELRDVLLAFRGSCPVELRLHPASQPHLEAWVRADSQWFVSPKQVLMRRLEKSLGEDNVIFRGKPASAARRNGSWRGREGGSGGATGQARGMSDAASPAVTRFN